MKPNMISQDPYLKILRNIPRKLKYVENCCIFSEMFPAITGVTEKMSSSSPDTTIYLSDNPGEIKEKIMKYAKSGERWISEKVKILKINLDEDIPYQYLRFFLEDDKELDRIRLSSSVRMMTPLEVKKKLS